MNSTQTAAAGTAAVLLITLIAAPAFADTATSAKPSDGHRSWGGMMQRHMPGVVGTVTAISGSSITVTGHAGPNGGTGTVYTIDASNATIDKDGNISTLGSIAIGDTIAVQGTMNGTSVTATNIHDGRPMKSGDKDRDGHRGMMGRDASSTPAFTGNGQPIVGGTVSAISGTSITLTNKAGATYTVDTGSATITKPGSGTTTASSIAVGDSVIVQGAINGTAVTASTIIDHGTTMQGHSGFFGILGGFFTRLFGFF